MKSVSERMKQIRKEQTMTQVQLAKLAGLSPRTIQNYEIEISEPTGQALVKIAEALGVSIDWLCGLTEKRERNQ